MRRTDDKPNALRATTAPGIFESLQGYAVQMEKIQRSLEVFYFVYLFSLFKNETLTNNYT